MFRSLLLVALSNRLIVPAQPGTVFDLSKDFTLDQTPASRWQYGYSADNSLDPKQFRADSFLDNLAPIAFWHPLTNDRRGPGYYPYVAFNRSDKTELEPTHGWAARAGQITMEASNTGQFSLVRFLVPATGRYQITARFEGVHFRLSSTDVHVLRGPVHLFDGEVEGYGGDPEFHQVQGAHPVASYSGTVDLKLGEVVTFAVGYGKDKTNYNDTTGLTARLVRLSGEQH